MHAFVQNRWIGGFLDYARGPSDYRIQVQCWLTLGSVEGLYFVRPRDPRLVWNYLREIGPAAVWTKIRSRWAEAGRNEKYVSCGFGVVTEGPPDGLPLNSTVVFLASKHPRVVDRLTIPADWCAPAAPLKAEYCVPDKILFQLEDSATTRPDWWNMIAGWDAESGISIPRAELTSILQDCEVRLRQTKWSAATLLDASGDPVREFTSHVPVAATRPQAMLFGYGNYAKTAILPYVRSHIDLIRIHEVDPIQLGRPASHGCISDTSPLIRPDERFDACFIAGFHHTHARLAIESLRRGAYAVVEKPTVTTLAQLAALLIELEAQPDKLFECFQRRYSILNDWARHDLELGPDDPVDYHAIVYEVPLPARHWYRWPNSRSRLTSNGCHWIDHFLFLNGYCPPERLELSQGPRGVVNCSISLRNGAYGTIVLTDHGSERTGVQDHVELRANGKTAFLDDNCRYRSEGRLGMIRRRSVHKQAAYRNMYRTIAREIAEKTPRDARRALRVSAETVLALEEML